ncbi:MAG: hypothetical protein QOG94_828, partial [Solirubrobacteraceae bacterium]|nr:hypothetical protein [Solirubrobacteraceae bacterium]
MNKLSLAGALSGAVAASLIAVSLSP